jgi:hypothetical protein
MSTQLRRQVFGAIAPLTCAICGAAPCINPSFCRLCCEVDWHPTRKRPSIERNQPTPAPPTTIEAVKQAVRDRSVAALKQPATRARLHNCDADARAEIKQWLTARFQKED